MNQAGRAAVRHWPTVILCLLLFVNSENVYFKRSELFSAIFEIALIAACVLYLYMTEMYKAVTRQTLRQSLIIALSYMLLLLLIYWCNIEDSTIGNLLQKLAILGILLPLLILIFDGLGYTAALQAIVRNYVNIAAIVYSIGLIVWLLFNLGIHLPAIQVPYQWGGSKVGEGILGLTFDVQYSDIQFASGWSRFSLFYIEGGIAAAYFGLAGILEATCNPKPRMGLILLFSLCTFCTLSGFGMIFSPIVVCVGLFCSGALQRMSRKSVVLYAFSKLLIPLLLAITPIVILSLFSHKTNTNSIAAHSNDFTYGFTVFLNRPLLGYGIGNYVPLVNTVDGISGTSSSLMMGFIQGGILYVLAILLPFLVGFIISIGNKQYRSAALFAVMVLLYVNGMSDNSPVYVFMMALAYAYIYSTSVDAKAVNKPV